MVHLLFYLNSLPLFCFFWLCTVSENKYSLICFTFTGTLNQHYFILFIHLSSHFIFQFLHVVLLACLNWKHKWKVIRLMISISNIKSSNTWNPSAIYRPHPSIGGHVQKIAHIQTMAIRAPVRRIDDFRSISSGWDMKRYRSTAISVRVPMEFNPNTPARNPYHSHAVNTEQIGYTDWALITDHHNSPSVTFRYDNRGHSSLCI